MKRFLILTISIVFTGLIISCEPEEITPVGEPMDKIELMTGTWHVTNVTQVDVDAALSGYPLYARELDITNILPNNPFTDISINLENDMTFSIEKGSAFVNWPTSGNWELDYMNHPSNLLLTNNEDTLKLAFSNLSELVMNPATLVLSNTKQMIISDEEDETGDNDEVIKEELKDIIIYKYKIIKQ
ncbi:MAG: DUF5004 domain-containing protein [Bacteroidales bacterium]